jgi:hypothetical protein
LGGVERPQVSLSLPLPLVSWRSRRSPPLFQWRGEGGFSDIVPVSVYHGNITYNYMKTRLKWGVLESGFKRGNKTQVSSVFQELLQNI